MKRLFILSLVILSLALAAVTTAQAQGTDATNAPVLRQNEHTLGKPAAKITFMVFDDTQCEFCKELHNVLKILQKKYPNDLKIAYRNFPISSIHEFSYKEAKALECVNVIGGNDAFLNLLDQLYANTDYNNPDYLPRPETALYNRPRHMRWLMRHSRNIGILRTKLSKCVSQNTTKAKVDSDIEEGVRAGIMGTPTTFVYTGNHFQLRIEGAQPQSVFETIITTLLAQ